ncbi:MAG: glycosyltransferase family 1 protein [Spirochaetota bacterium]
MRILIDYTQIPVERLGVGNYAYNLILELLNIDKVNKYFVIIQDDENSFNNIANSNFHLIKVNHLLFRRLLFRFFLEQLYIPFLIFMSKIDIVHSLHYSFPLFKFKAKRVVNIYDLTFYLFPYVHQVFKRYYFRFFIKLAALLNNRIICISNSTLDDLINITGANSKECSVVYLGKSGIYKPSRNIKKIKEIKRKYNINGNYLLFIGTIEPRKNIESLIMAFNKVFKNKDPEISLVIAGKKGWYYNEIFELVKKLNIKDKVIFTGYVLEEEKPLLINGCKIFIYPSIYEGFGLPVLEAMACGAPVITSNISSMPEVAGNGALLLNNPKDVNEIASSIESLLTNKKELAKYRALGLKQSAKFNWKYTALKTLEIYKTVNSQEQ